MSDVACRRPLTLLPGEIRILFRPFLTALPDLTSKDRAKSPVVFQMKACHYSCWKPKCGTPDERKAGRLARNACADGPQDIGPPWTAARLRYRPAHRADQRRPSGCESRHALSPAAQAGA